MNDKIVTITFLTEHPNREYKTAAYPFSLKTLELIAELGDSVSHIEIIDFNGFLVLEDADDIARKLGGSVERDNDGQLVIYTNQYDK